MPHGSTRMQRKLQGLKTRIWRYNTQIRDELKRPLPDWLRMRKLKAAKLKAKDRVAQTLQGSQPLVRSLQPK